MTIAYFGPTEPPGLHMFHTIIVRCKKLEAWIVKLRTDEYRSGYNQGHIDGVIAGHSAQWHEGYNEGSRTQNAIDILNKTVKTSLGVMSIRKLVEHLRLYAQMVEAKDKQIELLQNRVASLQSIIRTLEAEADNYFGREDDHDE